MMSEKNKKINDCVHVLHIGLDNFDIHSYGCTTHVATFLIHTLAKNIELIFVDYPNLVRLNPSIPWKTRGNGAIALRIKIPCVDIEKIVDLVDNILTHYYEKLNDIIDIDFSVNEPGVVFVTNYVSPLFSKIYIDALTDVILPSLLYEKLQKLSNVYISKKFRGRGIVGAAAAIGWIAVKSDYTFELISYRSKYMYNRERCVDLESVKYFDKITNETTFNNIDYESNRVLITPHGADPILYGVRGDFVEDLKKALNIIKTCEPVTAWTLFRTNQATDAHAVDRCVSDLRIYRTARIEVTISRRPKVVEGGHVIIKGFDSTGSIDIIFFKPSRLTSIAKQLEIGDVIIVQGHVKPWQNTPYLHAEKLYIKKLTQVYICRVPKCPICRNRMTKKGFGKGYVCKKCKYTAINIKLECMLNKRNIQEKLYTPPPSELKHLVKPLKRYGKEHLNHPSLTEIPVDNVSSIMEPLLFL